MRIVLAGSPSFVVATFRKVSEHHEIVAIITQPPTRQGRGLKLTPTPVAELGAELGVSVYTPIKISEIYETLKAINFDVFLTFAYGQIIPERILKLPRILPLNIHASLLPKYRGAAPVQAAVLSGDLAIGVTLMVMVQAMDAGPMLFQAQAPLPTEATGGAALALVTNLVEANILPWLERVALGKYQLTPQGEGATYSPKLKVENAVLTSALTISEAERRVLAYNPQPAARALINGELVKVFAVSKTFVPQSLAISCADGTLYAVEYQRPARHRVKLSASSRL